MRLIDADKLDWWYKGRPIRLVIDEAPTIDAVEVVHSRWVKDSDGDEYCEICSRYMPIWESSGNPSEHNYCPCCGAKMCVEKE